MKFGRRDIATTCSQAFRLAPGPERNALLAAAEAQAEEAADHVVDLVCEAHQAVLEGRIGDVMDLVSEAAPDADEARVKDWPWLKRRSR